MDTEFQKDQGNKLQTQSAANQVAQRKSNKTGLPDNLKSGIENLSGHSMDDVKVHYNSSRPAQLQAHAFAQGNQIHLAPGQEKHLPHEAWHVVQQKQGRVRPTMQLKGNSGDRDVDIVQRHIFDCLFSCSEPAKFKTERELINDHLKEFLKKVEKDLNWGWYSRKSYWEWASHQLKNLATHNPTNDQVYYDTLVKTLTSIEKEINTPEKEEEYSEAYKSRKKSYESWKTNLVSLLKESELQASMQRLIDNDGTREHSGGPWIDRPSEERPIGQLPSGRFPNATLRDIHDSKKPRPSSSVVKAAYLNSAMAISDYKHSSRLYPNEELKFASARNQLHKSLVFFDGSKNVSNQQVMTDHGWTFFGEKGAENVSGSGLLTMRVNLIKAVVYTNELFSSHERGTEYATSPGSKFKFIKHEHGIYYFDQVAVGTISSLPQPATNSAATAAASSTNYSPPSALASNDSFDL
ncbi:MAG: DUF4157 domain-containing protein [Ekhidna sp.]